MKIKCEYCQSMVDSKEKYCPSCGSPLPEVPPPVRHTPPPAAKNRAVLALSLTILCAVGLTFFLVSLMSRPGRPTQSSMSKALAQIKEDPTNIQAHQTVITCQLDQGNFSIAYQHAQTMLLANPDGANGRWCVDTFQAYGQPDIAIRLALFSDHLTGETELFSQVSDTPIKKLLPDSPLRQALELFFGRTAGTITLSDLQPITYLSIQGDNPLTNGRAISIGLDPDGGSDHAVTLQVESGSSPSNLGLLYFQGLKRLEVWERQLETAELLLPQLTALTISGVQLTDLKPLSALQNLEELSILSSPLHSLEGLDAMSGLRSLTLVDTQLSDLSILSAQPGITQLTLMDNDALKSVASLSHMTQLTSLTLSGEALADLSPIAGLTGLRQLTVTKTSIRNTGFLSNLTHLEELYLYDNEYITEIPELNQLTQLTRLRVENDSAFVSQSDMGALKNLKALELLSYKDLSYLAPLSQLEELTLCFTRSQVDLGPLSAFQNLRRLSFESEYSFYNIYKADFQNLRALQRLPLEELNLGGHRTYEPLDPVLSIPTLRRLDLSDFRGEGTDFSKFSNLTQLEELDLSGFQDMADVPPGPGDLYWNYEARPASVFTGQLGRLTNLKRLNLSNCGVEDLSPLSNLTNLTHLNLATNNISDLSPLEHLTSLTYLNLSDNPIADYTPVENREGLIFIR